MNKTLSAIIPFILAVLLLLSCSQEISREIQEEKAAAKEAVQAEESGKPVVVSCEDTDSNDTYTRGKVTLLYNNGQKESFKDNCIEEGSVFPVFLLEYTCNNLNASSKLYKCDRNCSLGACNK